MCVTLKGIFCDPAHTLAIISIYMPTGMDGISEEDPRFVLGESIVRRINHELATHTHAIVVGDFNEVKSPALDRARGGLAVADDISSPGRLVGRLNLTDCHRSLNPAIPLYTNAQKVVQAGSTYDWITAWSPAASSPPTAKPWVWGGQQLTVQWLPHFACMIDKDHTPPHGEDRTSTQPRPLQNSGNSVARWRAPPHLTTLQKGCKHSSRRCRWTPARKL